MPATRRDRLQAWYYMATGLWPMVSMSTFELVTGRKRDRWLVRTVGLLAGLIGLSILRQAGRARPDPVLAVGAPLVFATVDVVYVARGRIRPVYLLDAAVELAFATASVTGTAGAGTSSGAPPGGGAPLVRRRRAEPGIAGSKVRPAGPPPPASTPAAARTG